MTIKIFYNNYLSNEIVRIENIYRNSHVKKIVTYVKAERGNERINVGDIK